MCRMTWVQGQCRSPCGEQAMQRSGSRPHRPTGTSEARPPRHAAPMPRVRQAVRDGWCNDLMEAVRFFSGASPPSPATVCCSTIRRNRRLFAAEPRRTLAGVDLSSLTPEQAAELDRRLGPMLGYLTRLTNRMQKRGWNSTDRVYARAWEARDALHEVCVRLHYASCGLAMPATPRRHRRRPSSPRGRGSRAAAGARGHRYNRGGAPPTAQPPDGAVAGAVRLDWRALGAEYPRWELHRQPRDQAPRWCTGIFGGCCDHLAANHLDAHPNRLPKESERRQPVRLMRIRSPRDARAMPRMRNANVVSARIGIRGGWQPSVR